VQLM